ncbi:hypothetical protein [Streptomyces canus]|uniref:hypothetical protein n=1 Tax=Streptomyces canus TaxID=58343 RepID=UPI0032443A07
MGPVLEEDRRIGVVDEPPGIRWRHAPGELHEFVGAPYHVDGVELDAAQGPQVGVCALRERGRMEALGADGDSLCLAQ